MALRVAVVAEGNASSAVKAMGDTRAAVAGVSAENRIAAASTNEVAAAATREQAALVGATAATNANTVAVRSNAQVMRTAQLQRANLIFQLNDVVVSLASGMNPAMVAVQQGSQIMQNGVGAAVRGIGSLLGSVVTKFWPVALAAGVVTAAVAGMTHEINKSGNAIQVSWGDVALGTLQTIGDGLYGLVKPAVDALSGWFKDNWDTIVGYTKSFINSNVRNFLVMFEQIKGGVAIIPLAFQIGGEEAAKLFLVPIQAMVDKTVEGINVVIDAINRLGGGLIRLEAPKLAVDFGAAGARESIDKITQDVRTRIGEIYTTDYAGDFFSSVAGNARKNASADDGKKSKASEYAGEIAQIRERTAALQIERAAIGMSTFEAERMRKVFELENAARKDAIGLTPQRIAQINREATAYAAANAVLENTKMIYDTLKGAWSGMFSDLGSHIRENVGEWTDLGSAVKGVWEGIANSVANALGRIGDKMTAMAADAAFDWVWKTLLGGLTGGLSIAGGAAMPTVGFIPGITGPKLFAKGGISSEPAIFGDGPTPEAAVPLPDGRSIPVKLSGGAAMGGGAFTLNDNRKITISGGMADEGELRRILAEDRAALLAKLPSAIRYLQENPRRESLPA